MYVAVIYFASVYRFSIRLIFGIVLTVVHLWFSFYSCIHTFSYDYSYGLTSLFCTLRTLNRVPYLSRMRVLCVAQSLLLCAVVCRSLVVLLYPLLLHYMSVLPFVASDTLFVVFNIFLINCRCHKMTSLDIV